MDGNSLAGASHCSGVVGTSLWPRGCVPQGRRAHMFPWDVPKSPYVPESPCLPQLSPPVHWGLCTALTQRRVPQVNGVCMEGKQHADVVAAIKAGGDETKLLVVDVLTDEFFKKCKVVPSEAHLAGPLPEPVANGDVGKEDDVEPRPSSVSDTGTAALLRREMGILQEALLRLPAATEEEFQRITRLFPASSPPRACTSSLRWIGSSTLSSRRVRAEGCRPRTELPGCQTREDFGKRVELRPGLSKARR
nr:PREDICTED: Na(+)/H(+) exchange regulatory cofactor NHE-RF1 [Apteryx mantelli mantelli]